MEDEIEQDASNHTGGTEIRNAKEATCAAEGYTGDTYCLGCNAKLESGKAIAKKDHTWDAGTVTKAATCAAKGVKTYTCTVCKATKEEEIEIDANNHTGETEIRDAKEATCTAEGYTGDTYCLGCNAKLKSGETIAKKDHTWDAGTVTKAATCTAKGVMTYTCTVCKEATKTEIIDVDPANHDGGTEIKDAKDATCTEDGYTGDTYCKGCGRKIADGEIIKAPGHTWSEWTVKKAAACTEKGEEVRTCSVCSKTETREIAAAGHKMTATAAKDATCLEDGNKAYWTCSVCSKLYSDEAGQTETTAEAVVIPALGHDDGVWTEIPGKTKYDDTIRQRRCTRCNALLEEVVIPGAKHDWRYNCIVTSAGIRYQDVMPELTDEWFMFTPLDLSQEGTVSYDLIINNNRRCGTIDITVEDGKVTITYKTFYGVDMKDLAFTLLPDISSLEDLETIDYTAFSFENAIDIEKDLNGDTKVILQVMGHANADYSTNLPYAHLGSNDEKYQEMVEKMKEIMD